MLVDGFHGGKNNQDVFRKTNFDDWLQTIFVKKFLLERSTIGSRTKWSFAKLEFKSEKEIECPNI